MKKLSLMLALVMVLAMLFAISVFADEVIVLGPDQVVSATAEGTTYGSPEKLFDGDTTVATGGWYRYDGKGWTGGEGAVATIVFDKEYVIQSAQLYVWSNWPGGATFEFIDAKGNSVTTANAANVSDGTPVAIAGTAGVKFQTLVITMKGNKWNGNGFQMGELVINAIVAPDCTHDMDKYMDGFEITKEATCTTPAEITYECQGCGEEITTVPTYADVTDNSDLNSVKTNGAGGFTSGPLSLYDNDINTYLHASGGWFVESEMTLNMNYYLTSATVVVGSWGNHDSNGAYTTFYYKAPGETEWITYGTMQTPVEYSDTKYTYTLEFDEPVLASAVKIRVDGLASFSGQAFEAQVAGSLLSDGGVSKHAWVAGETVAPTCVDNGYTNYACSNCGLTKQADFVEETKEHTMADATCEAPSTCSVCGKTEGEALGHNYVPGEKAEDGSVTYTCANCNDVYVINNSAVNGEYFLGTDALTFADGVLTTMGKEYSYENNLTTGMITTNDETIYFQVIEGKIYFKGAEVLHQHNEETLIVETTNATCTEDGKVVTTCPFCGILSEETIVAEGHINAWSEIYEYVSATCITEGYEKDICAVCNEEYTVIIPVDTVLGHNAISGTEEYLDATCISDGYYKFQCDICNEEVTIVYESDENAHAWDEALSVFVPATCVAGGYSYNKCSLCGTEVTEEFDPSEWAHNYNDGVVSDGVIVYTCTLCGDSYEEELPTALPYGDTTVEIVAGEYGWTESVYYSVSVPGNYVLTIKNEANVYVVYGEYESELIETSTFAFTLAEGESIQFSVMTSDFAEGTVELNLASADNAAINGTYVSADGSALFVFADGVLTITDTNEMMPSGSAGTYTYNYNSVTGEVANSANLPMTVRNGVIFVYGRMPLNVYVPPMDVVLGDNEITVTNTNYFFDGIKVVFTATEAGTYVITASETGVVIVEGVYGSEMVELPFEVELAEGQAFEFIVTSSANAMMGENDTVVVNIAKKVTHVHVEEIIPAVRPTPSVTGMTAGVKCSECGETLVAQKEINVTDMADTRDPNFRVAAASLTLMDSIIVNYKSVVTAGYNNAYMVFVFRGEEYVVESTGVEASTGRLIFDFDKVEAHWMNENIEAYVYAETAEGEYSRNMILEYSVKNYAINQLKKNDAALTTVISDLLVMGAKTQLYTGYNTDELVTDVVEAAGYTLTPTAFAGVDASYNIATPVTGDRTTGTDWKSGAVYLGSRTVLQLKFLTDDVDTLTVKVTVGKETVEYTKEDFEYEASTGRYIVNVDFFSAMQYGVPAVGIFERDGVQVGSTITYSVNAYAYRNADMSNAKGKDLVRALYVYGQSVEAYFG